MQAFPWDTAPRFLLRDRDGNYGKVFRKMALGLGIKEVLCAPRSPWQNAYAERLIGSIRRECLDHVIVLHESGLRRVLRSYFEYYAHSRTHLSLEKDAPIPRAVQPPDFGKMVELPEVGGLPTDTSGEQPDRSTLVLRLAFTVAVLARANPSHVRLSSADRESITQVGALKSMCVGCDIRVGRTFH